MREASGRWDSSSRSMMGSYDDPQLRGSGDGHTCGHDDPYLIQRGHVVSKSVSVSE